MSFVETMPPATTSTSSSTTPIATTCTISTSSSNNNASATDAVTFTTEEISMFQELFLTSSSTAAFEPLKIVVDDNALVSDKDFHISDIAIFDSALALKADELMLGPSDDATSVLLSPIGSDEPFVHQFLFDEKDAMAAFYTEAIDPFENPSPIKVEPSIAPVAAASPLSRSSREHDELLATLRTKVDALSTMYYTRCHRLQHSNSIDSSNNAVDVVTVQRLHALQKLQRVAAALTAENKQLVAATTSTMQQREAVVASYSTALTDAATLAQIVESIDAQACTDAIAAATARAVACTVDGDNSQTVMGWQHQCAVSADNVVTFAATKTFPDIAMRDVLRKTWEAVSSSAQFSQMVGAAAHVQVIKTLGADAAVLLCDVANHDATRVDRVLSLVFRAELPDKRVVLGSCAINPAHVPAVALATSGSSVRWMDSALWQIHDPRNASEHVVTVGGTSAYPTETEARVMALESVCSLLRWESATIGAPFAFAL